MQSGLSVSRHLAKFAAVGLVLAVAGCQSNDTAGLLGLGGSSGEQKQKITVEELRAFCPRVGLRSDTAFYTTHARGGEGDPTKIIQQASISDVTRACTYGPGTTTVNVAAAGRVVPGPASQGGTVTLPIHVQVRRGEEVLYSQIHQYQVAIAPGGGATQFVFNDPNVTIANADRAVQVVVGFDEKAVGTKKKPAAE